MDFLNDLNIKHFLSFKINNFDYCIEIVEIKEIIEHIPITKVYHSLDYISGIINLRGQIYSIISLNSLFYQSICNKSNNKIIILKDTIGNLVGFEIEDLNDIFSINIENIEIYNESDFIENNTINRKDFITGVCKIDSKIYSIVNSHKIFEITLSNSKANNKK